MGDSTGGVVGLLEVIGSDFARLEAETNTAEDEAYKEHDRFLAVMQSQFIAPPSRLLPVLISYCYSSKNALTLLISVAMKLYFSTEDDGEAWMEEDL